MPAARRGGVLRRLAPLALMPAGAFAVHQLRYLLAFHGHAGVELQRQGHAYLHSLVPWIALGIALVAGAFVRALGRAFGGRCSLPRYTVSFAMLWLACSACLVAIYVSQELLEGLFATGHPAGLVGVLGYGGWWSIPAALAVGLVLAAAFHGASWVLREVAQRRSPQIAVRRARVAPARRFADVLALRLWPLADGWSGRGPPR
ncbi:MAG: hypothetical protein ACYDHH_13085 [Solirubrobacteraceae bacterium]